MNVALEQRHTFGNDIMKDVTIAHSLITVRSSIKHATANAIDAMVTTLPRWRHRYVIEIYIIL